jgi:hypothetical protein
MAYDARSTWVGTGLWSEANAWFSDIPDIGVGIRRLASERDQSYLMTDYNPSDLLSRLRADRANILAARRLLVDQKVLSEGDGSAERFPVADSGVTPSTNTVTNDEDSGDATASLLDPSLGGVFADEEIAAIRAIRAKADQVDARLESLQEWVAETRTWVEKFEAAHRSHSDLGRLEVESQVRIDAYTKAAEERAELIVAEAKEQAEQLLAAAEIVAGEIISADVPVEDAPPATVPDSHVEVVVATPEDSAVEGDDPGAIETTDADAEELYEVIELFTRTNAELVNELSALISAIPRRNTK